MRVMIEYHGWVTLFCAVEGFSDNDWREARRSIQREIAVFLPEDGHWVTFAETTESMQTLQLSGHTEQQIEPLLRLMEFVGRAVPGSYGELLVIQDKQPNLAAASRYQLFRGKVSQCANPQP
jgi:hypothetical protein